MSLETGSLQVPPVRLGGYLGRKVTEGRGQPFSQDIVGSRCSFLGTNPGRDSTLRLLRGADLAGGFSVRFWEPRKERGPSVLRAPLPGDGRVAPASGPARPWRAEGCACLQRLLPHPWGLTAVAQNLLDWGLRSFLCH